MKRLLNWLDDRTGCREIVNDALYENVPGGARWRYVWGSTLVFAFFTQMITGFFLWTAYSPNAQGAWESVYYIQHEMQGGWLLRGIHHFMAQLMILLLALHLMQVVIDGAYRAPREINFWLGLVLMLIVLGLSLTGYLLPWDQKGFWATKVATNIMGITPGIGPQLQQAVVGGSEYGHQTLTRFFAIYAGLLPALLIGFLALHIYVFRRHGVTAPSAEWGDDTPFWPDQLLKDGVACLAVLAFVLGLILWRGVLGESSFGPELGAELGAPADPTDQYSAARPEWYFLFLFQILKYFPGESEVIGSHVLPGLVMLVLFAMPFLGNWNLGHRFNIGFLVVLLLGVGGLTGMAIYEDSQSEEYLAAKAEAEMIAERVPRMVEEYGISTAGAVELVRNDPYLHGPKLFKQNCSGCHRYNGHDGTGENPADAPSAADLGNFGSREWLKSVLLDYENHFAPLKNAVWDGENVGERFLEGDMAYWSAENRETLSDPVNQGSLNALVEFVVAQSQRDDLRPFDDELVSQGRTVFTDGALEMGELSSVCTDCHSCKPVGEEEDLNEFAIAPTLTNYGGRQWLREFIANPARPSYYGYDEGTNAMPAFGERLSERELELLVRWMIGDYLSPEGDAENSPTAD